MPVTLTRSILVILLPGVVAFAPWALLIVSMLPKSKLELYADFPVLVHVVLFAIVVIIGSFLEIKITQQEVEWDKEREGEFQIQRNWYKYLSNEMEKEPVGFRYLSRIFTTMQYEMAMAHALAAGIVGVSILLLMPFKGINCFLIFGAGLFVAQLLREYFMRAAYESHEVLCRTRKEIMDICTF